MKLILENWKKYLKEGSNTLNYMRGDCALLATAIGDASGLPIYGVVDGDGNIHHVFVYDPGTDEAIDCRGRQPVGDVTNNIKGHDLTLRKVSPEELQKAFGLDGYDEEEWEQAEEEALAWV
jgi:hypothetical protein